MTLLNEVMHSPMDAGYADAARLGNRRGGGSVAVIAVLAVGLGAVGASASMQLRGSDPSGDAVRRVLVDQVTQRQGRVVALGEQAHDLDVQITALRSRTAADRARMRSDVVDTDGMGVGALTVQGPGLVVTVADGPSAASGDTNTMVRDIDLQKLVNALWAGGAEAIAINGHRLTSLSAIRMAGSAVLVDLEPLMSPYLVQAIGDAEQMQVSMVRTGVSDHLRLLSTEFTIRSAVTAQSTLTLFGASDLALHYAQSGQTP